MCDHMSDEDTGKLRYAGEPVTKGHLSEGQERAFREEMPVVCCGRCKFWDEHDLPTFSAAACGEKTFAWVEHSGDCVKNAPIVITPTPHGLADNPATAWWPETQVAAWCGCYEERGEKDESTPPTPMC